MSIHRHFLMFPIHSIQYIFRAKLITVTEIRYNLFVIHNNSFYLVVKIDVYPIYIYILTYYNISILVWPIVIRKSYKLASE